MLTQETIINISQPITELIKKDVWGNEFLTAVIGLLVAILAFFVPHIIERSSEMREQFKSGLDKLIPHPGWYILWVAIGIIITGSAFLTESFCYRAIVSFFSAVVSIYALIKAVEYVKKNYDYIKEPAKVLRKIYLFNGKLIHINRSGNFVEVLKNRMKEGDYEFVEEGVDGLLKCVSSSGQGSSEEERGRILEEITKLYNFIKRTESIDLNIREVEATTRIGYKLVAFLSQATTVEINLGEKANG